MTHASVTIQITPQSQPATPAWMGEVATFAQGLAHLGTLKAIAEQVRFARARFGQYDLIDFVAVWIGDMLSGEPTLLAFYERLVPFAHEMRNELVEELSGDLEAKVRPNRTGSPSAPANLAGGRAKRAAEREKRGPAGKRWHEAPPGEASLSEKREGVNG